MHGDLYIINQFRFLMDTPGRLPKLSERYSQNIGMHVVGKTPEVKLGDRYW